MCSNEPSSSHYIQSSYNPSIVQIPHRLPVIEGLHRSIHSLSLESIRTLRAAFRSADVEQTGLLGKNTLLKCLAEVIPDASHVGSPWRRFLDTISKPNQVFPYVDLIRLINAAKHGDQGEGPSIEEILSLQKSALIQTSGESLRRVHSEKLLFERSYAKIIIDLELLISKSSDQIDIDRLKLATHQEMITVKEFIDILSIYGVDKLFEPIIGRIIIAFQDAQGKFNYSDFVKCLDRVQPSLLLNASTNSAPFLLPSSSLASEKPPLGPILSAEKEQSGTSKWSDKQWEDFYMKGDDEE